MRFARLATAVAALVLIVSAQAEVLLATAPHGTTNGGTTVYQSQYLGARFSLDSDHRITSIGGHFKGEVGTDRSLFLALIQIAGPAALPILADLPNPLFATTFVAPYNDVGPYPQQVDDTLISVSFDLAAGDYALIAGSGLFGATGSGWMPLSGPIQPLPWFFRWNGNIAGSDFANVDEQPMRFLVNGYECSPFPGGGQTGACLSGPGPFPAPEPSTAALLVLALAALAFASRRTPPSAR